MFIILGGGGARYFIPNSKGHCQSKTKQMIKKKIGMPRVTVLGLRDVFREETFFFLYWLNYVLPKGIRVLISGPVTVPLGSLQVIKLE
jgi:hypothetical protein